MRARDLWGGGGAESNGFFAPFFVHPPPHPAGPLVDGCLFSLCSFPLRVPPLLAYPQRPKGGPKAKFDASPAISQGGGTQGTERVRGGGPVLAAIDASPPLLAFSSTGGGVGVKHRSKPPRVVQKNGVRGNKRRKRGQRESESRLVPGGGRGGGGL